MRMIYAVLSKIFFTSPLVGVQSIAISVSVCLFACVCVRLLILKTPCHVCQMAAQAC